MLEIRKDVNEFEIRITKWFNTSILFSFKGWIKVLHIEEFKFL